MNRAGFGCCLSLLAIAIPATAGAQQLHPCTPVAPGVRCAGPVAQPWARLDFGAPKPLANDDSAVTGQWQRLTSWAVIPFQHAHTNVPFREIMRRRSSDTGTPADCSALKYAAHKSEIQMAPSLPPLPAIQAPLVIGHGHTSKPPAANVIVSPCQVK